MSWFFKIIFKLLNNHRQRQARIPKTEKNICFTEVRGKKVFAKIGSPKFIKEGQLIFKERQ